MERLPKYYQLNPDKVMDTVVRLGNRIRQRFPDAGLNGVCATLREVCKHARERSDWIGQPIWPVRIATYAITLAVVVGLVMTFISIRPASEDEFDLPRFVELLEAGINDLILIGAAFFFLFTLETRIKRKRALKAIHELRSIAHVIDMHQLTKDPDRLLKDRENTEDSPDERHLTPFLLRRYLDYCSELLSLTSKIAALYLNNFEDQAAVGAVNEIEDLTTGLQRKIWQKIMILQTF